MKHGFNRRIGAFVQSYGSEALDASALRLPIIGLIDATDPRMLSTIRQIERNLMHDGLVYRYRGVDDGIPGEEKGTFIMCTFWLIDNYILLGRLKEAEELFEHILSLQNDVGLLSEEVDPEGGEFLGNFPQGFSHIALINSAARLEAAREGRKPTPHEIVEGITRRAA
jgi:GH15 family glucan-1,4-alpha-glucosidase